MDRTLFLIAFIPLICILSSPVREKISINTDLLRKVREQENGTTRDPKARNINFAWKVSFTRSTTQALEKTTLAIKDIENNQIEYQKIFTQLTATLKDLEYRKLWTDLVKKGYPHFLSEVKTGGHKKFMKDNKDGAFAGNDGDKFWGKIVGFLETMGEKGFELLINSIDNAPVPVTTPPPQPGAEKPNEPPKQEAPAPTQAPK